MREHTPVLESGRSTAVVRESPRDDRVGTRAGGCVVTFALDDVCGGVRIEVVVHPRCAWRQCLFEVDHGVERVHVDDDNVATLDMTLTSAACPLTDVIEDQTRQALTSGPGGGLVSDVRINWVWMPPWGPDKITDDGREQLRALGFNV